jgi:hypothetical protein
MRESAVFKIKSANPDWELMTYQYRFMPTGCLPCIRNCLPHASRKRYVRLTPGWSNWIVEMTPGSRLSKNSVTNRNSLAFKDIVGFD